MKSRYEIFNNDCLEQMKSIPDKSVDLVIIDPPYIINQGGAGAFGKDKKYHGEISHIIDGFDFNVLEKLNLKMKKTNLYIFCNKTLLFELIKYYQKSHPKLILDILTWEKTNPIPVCNNKYLSDLEYVLFIKEKGVKIAGTYETKRKNYRSPLNVKDKRKYNHPTPKPVPLLKNYIINSCPEGGTVLDCFMGSGSCGEAALSLGRKFIGIEKDKKYFKTAKKRIEESLK